MYDRRRSDILFGLLVCGIAVLVAVGVASLTYQGMGSSVAGGVPSNSTAVGAVMPSAPAGLLTLPSILPSQPTLIAGEMADLSITTSASASHTIVPVPSSTSIPSPTIAASTPTDASSPTAEPTRAAPTNTPVPPMALPTFSPSATVEAPAAATPTTEATSAPVSETVMVVPTIPATATSFTEGLLQRVATAEEHLRSGEFDVMGEIGPNARSSARVRFTYGDEQRAPTAHITTTYGSSTADTQSTEYLQVGGQAWERRDGQDWTSVSLEAGPEHHLASYLPHIETAADPTTTITGDRATLSWYDTARDTDVMLVVDAVTGTPLEMRRVGRSTGLIVTVAYRGWNTSVVVTPPDNQ
jgi:hypothetical protein